MWPDEITYANHTIGRGFEKMNPSIPKRGRVGSLPSNSLSLKRVRMKALPDETMVHNRVTQNTDQRAPMCVSGATRMP